MNFPIQLFYICCYQYDKKNLRKPVLDDEDSDSIHLTKKPFTLAEWLVIIGALAIVTAIVIAVIKIF